MREIEERQRQKEAGVDPALKALRDSATRTEYRAHEIYDSVYLRAGREAAGDAAVAFLRSSPYVDSLWFGHWGLEVRFAGYNGSLVMAFHPPRGLTDRHAAPPALSPGEVGHRLASALISILRRGGVRVYAPPGYTAAIRIKTVLSIKTILEMKAADETEKYVRLTRLIGGPEWFVANYNAEEWHIVGHEGDK
jgi:hypothetical protein